MKSQNAQLKVATSSKFKVATSVLFRGSQFLCERENSVHQRSVLLKDWATTNLLTSKFRRFSSLREGRMLPAVLA